MKKSLVFVLAFMLFFTIFPVTSAHADEEFNVDDLVRFTCEATKSCEFIYLTMTHSLDMKGDIVFGSHEINNYSDGEETLPNSVKNSILGNNDIRSMIDTLKSAARKRGGAIATTSDIILKNTKDLEYSINKCNISMNVKYDKKACNYQVYITITDKYDFTLYSIIKGCNLIETNYNIKRCIVSIANDAAATAQLLDKMSDYNIEIKIDFVEN